MRTQLIFNLYERELGGGERSNFIKVHKRTSATNWVLQLSNPPGNEKPSMEEQTKGAGNLQRLKTRLNVCMDHYSRVNGWLARSYTGPWSIVPDIKSNSRSVPLHSPRTELTLCFIECLLLEPFNTIIQLVIIVSRCSNNLKTI